VNAPDTNFIQTVNGRNFIATVRLYGTGGSFFDQTWEAGRCGEGELKIARPVHPPGGPLSQHPAREKRHENDPRQPTEYQPT
jgi:hypothetical protein